jgi:transposase InsO family protein
MSREHDDGHRDRHGTAGRSGLTDHRSINALMESFWSRVQVELLDRQVWPTRLELATALFEYLESFHNRRRRHSSLGMLTPFEFETRQGSLTTSTVA